MAAVDKAAVEQLLQEVLVPGLPGKVLALEPGIDLLGNELCHKVVVLFTDLVEVLVQFGDIEVAQQLGVEGQLIEPPPSVVDAHGDALVPGTGVLVLVPAGQGSHKFQGDVTAFHRVQPGLVRRSQGGGVGNDAAGGGDDHQRTAQVLGGPIGEALQLLAVQGGLDQVPSLCFLHGKSSLC